MHYVILHIVLRHIPSYTLSAGVAQGDIHLRFAWQAWHLWHWVARLGWFWSPVTPRHFAAALCVAGVAQSHIHLRFAWQAWHVWHWVAHLGWFWSPVTPRHFEWQARHKVTSTFVSRGRRGTWSHPRWFHVAGVALMALGGALGLVLVARDAAALCRGTLPRHFAWQAWHNLTSIFVLRGRRGTYGTGWRTWAGFGRP